jgi:RNA polymerase sigma factor (sigma-70 family)
MPLAEAIPSNMPDHSSAACDRDPVARFRAGDREAFTLIYRLHSPAVFRFAMHMTGDRMKAAEITQDVFVWLIHHPGNYDASRGELGAFLLGVTRKPLLRLLRNERKWVPLNQVGKGAGKALRTSPPPGCSTAQSGPCAQGFERTMLHPKAEQVPSGPRRRRSKNDTHAKTPSRKENISESSCLLCALASLREIGEAELRIVESAW